MHHSALAYTRVQPLVSGRVCVAASQGDFLPHGLKLWFCTRAPDASSATRSDPS